MYQNEAAPSYEDTCEIALILFGGQTGLLYNNCTYTVRSCSSTLLLQHRFFLSDKTVTRSVCWKRIKSVLRQGSFFSLFPLKCVFRERQREALSLSDNLAHANPHKLLKTDKRPKRASAGSSPGED